MKRIFSCFVIFMLLVSPCMAYYVVFPTPTITGATGLIRVPSADVIPYKNYNIAAEVGSNLMAEKQAYNYKANLGTFHGVEFGLIGGSKSENNQVALREGVFINMKVSLATDDSDLPLKLAIGVENLASFTQTDVYMVATKYFQQGFKLTFGFMGDFPNDRFRPLGALGIELPLGSSNLVLLADGLAGETIGQLNAGIRFYFTPTFALHVNGVNLLQTKENPNVGKEPKSIFAGFSWANPF